MLEVSIRKKLSSFTLDLSFRTESGSVAILGVSGSGKSVLLKCIAGIMKPDSGYIILDGKVLFDSEKRINLSPQERHIGYMFQSYTLFPDMTVKENILAGLNWEKDRQKKHDEAVKMARMLRIDHILDSRPSKISGGEAQRTALARMLVNRPCLLLFDEPFSALDVHLRSELQMELADLLRRIGKEYILVTHSKDEAFSLSDITYVLDKGEIIRQGSPSAVFSNPGSLRAAKLVGYHNISRAERHSDGLYLEKWGIAVDADASPYAVAVADDAAAFSEDGLEASVFKIIKDVNSTLVLLRFRTESFFWMRIPPETPVPEKPRVSIRKESILMLSE